MKVAVTGATGFVGRYLINELSRAGYEIKAWYRSEQSKEGTEGLEIEWIKGALNDSVATERLLDGVDAVIHSGLHHPDGNWNVTGAGFLPWVETNLLGTLRLMSLAKERSLERFIFVSTCAVHDKILSDRILDEAHPLWPYSNYGAHKAALEKFVHSFGYGQNFPICAVRPTGIYGVSHPISDSKWFSLIKTIKEGRPVTVQKGGKEVHVADVAKALTHLLTLPAEKIRGEAFNCYDMYISEHMVASLAKELIGSDSQIEGEPTSPKNQISSEKIMSLGVTFGGDAILKETVEQLLEAA